MRISSARAAGASLEIIQAPGLLTARSADHITFVISASRIIKKKMNNKSGKTWPGRNKRAARIANKLMTRRPRKSSKPRQLRIPIACTVGAKRLSPICK
jgi:hypothetical protein